MSVPIHNLYDYIYQVLEKRYFLYYFYPFGQKELFNLIAYVNTLSDDYKDNSKILYTQMNSFHFADENYITCLIAKEICMQSNDQDDCMIKTRMLLCNDAWHKEVWAFIDCANICDET